MSNKKPKQPEKKYAGKIGLTDSKNAPVSTDGEAPAFSFQHLHKDYCIKSLEQDDKVALVEKLEELSAITWSDIKLGGRHALGSEKISLDAIKVSKPDIITPDITLLAIRFSGIKPMIGFRDQLIFHLVYLDHNFTVYKH